MLTVGPQGLVDFCANRLDAEQYKLRSRANVKGISNKEVLESALNVERYVDVLRAIWGERSLDKRLQFLRKHSNHAICLYERALAEFEKSPTKETVTRVSLPLLKLAAIRNGMDVYCNPNEQVEGAILAIDSIYRKAMSNLIQEKVRLSSESLIKVEEKFLDQLKSLKENIPNLLPPVWILDHTVRHSVKDYGDGVLRVSGEMYWNELRDLYMQMAIGKAEANLKNLKGA